MNLHTEILYGGSLRPENNWSLIVGELTFWFSIAKTWNTLIEYMNLINANVKHVCTRAFE